MKQKILILAALAMILPANARNYRSYEERANHFITLSLGGGESNTLSSQAGLADVPKVTDALGADALLGLGYEIRFRKVFIGLQAQLDYDLTRQKIGYFEETRDGYADLVYGSDGSRQIVSYKYMYDAYTESQSHLQGSGQLHVGGNIGKYAYLMAGAKFSASFNSGYFADVMLSTTKIYTGVMAPTIGNLSDKDGAYSSHLVNPKPNYHYTDPEEDKNALRANPFRFKVSPLIEAGVRLRVPSNSGRVGMRLGVYAEWALPIMNKNIQGANLIVYDEIERNIADGHPIVPESRRLLDERLRINSILNTNVIVRDNILSLTQLTVGIKWTVLFNVTAPRHFCVLCED